jgi:tetratricopeptide (TPR) repeat protein
MPGMAHHDHDDAPAPNEKLGKVSFPTSCAPKSRVAIARGVALLHSFGYAKAQMQFQAIEHDDPTCAMGHWGIAMTQYQELWGQPEAEALKLGADEMAIARTFGPQATPRERAYIDALSAFFDSANTTYRLRADAYVARMDALHAAFPDDVEGGAFDALAILADTPPGDTSLTHERRALAILEPLYAKHPDHPGLAHYIIHTCDTPALAREGLAAARAYARIAPASPHALHMPAHIFARLGLWSDDIASNLASIAASDKAEAAHEPGTAHQMHAKEFLVYAYLQVGEDDKARQLTASMAGLGARMAAMPGMDDMKGEGHFFDNELRAVYALETHDWQGAAALQAAPGTTPYDGFDIYWAQGVAAGHLHDAKLSAAALTGFDQALDAVKASPYADSVAGMEVMRNEILGWQALAEDRPDAAIAFMRQAADAQDKHGQNEVDIPAREMLGDLLLMLHRPEAALVEYRTALTLSPNRLNGLLSAATAAAQSGHPDEARDFHTAAARQTRRGKPA